MAEDSVVGSLGERWARAWNARDEDALAALYSPECICVDIADGSSFRGQEGILDTYARTVAAMPDFHVRSDGCFTDGSDYVIEWTFTGTSSGVVREVSGASIGTLDGSDRILRRRDYWNMAALYGSGGRGT